MGSTRATRSPRALALAALAVLALPGSASSHARARLRAEHRSAARVLRANAARRRHRHRGRHRHRARASQVCPESNAPAAFTPRQLVRRAVLCLVNEQRAVRGLPRLHASGQLTRSAQGWSNALSASGSFWHGASFSARITATGYRWSAVAENIAEGYPTARSVVGAWMGDAGHCQNILNPSYRDIGIGINGHVPARAPRGGAIWTQDFGLRLSQSPRSGNWGPADGCPY